MGVDVLDIFGLQSGHRQRVAHRQEGTLAVFGGGRLVEGVATVAVAGHIGKRPFAGIFFKYEEACALAEVEPRACGVKRPARLVVQDHQGVEAVEVEAAEGFRAAGNDDVNLVPREHLCAQDDGVERRGAGSRDGAGPGPFEAGHPGHLVRALAAIVALGQVK